MKNANTDNDDDDVDREHILSISRHISSKWPPPIYKLDVENTHNFETVFIDHPNIIIYSVCLSNAI